MLAFCLKKKKSSKSVSLNQGNVEKGHPASGNIQQQKAHAAVSCRGSKLLYKGSPCQLKHCLLSHPRTNCVHGEGFLRARCSWSTLNKGNSCQSYCKLVLIFLSASYHQWKQDYYSAILPLKKKNEKREKLTFIYPPFTPLVYPLGYFLVAVSKRTSLGACLQTFPRPFGGQVKLSSASTIPQSFQG